jgi:bisphosphoglycerate-independent phosphoglycerate mutase (AlkP superfamily)
MPLAKLSAIAPTTLQLLGLPVPAEMTTPSLFVA